MEYNMFIFFSVISFLGSFIIIFTGLTDNNFDFKSFISLLIAGIVFFKLTMMENRIKELKNKNKNDNETNQNKKQD